ncbi:terminase small subunit [Achromobacter xylosoxidans]|uniref:hypothetical protein n=1 Tax=Alcaligenes xylosoxydans xylosoxydans TaxID=85698 RepID=UPI000A6BE37C|nr:hypothetical protein [Achromobacter xylosoxidans]QKQ52593.1 hypothetical protein FOC83_06265 [Achromobacter xylosoxidans]QPR92524.1 hypothetical protein I6G72_17765 [Achromobacter xylosoxidans]UON42203.1 hypothetical protein IUJ48_08880 [Achromobacter xylosoxidans]
MVQALRDKLSAKLEVTAQRVLEKWVDMGFYDGADLVVTDENGVLRDITSPKDLRLLPERVRRCVIGWTYDKGGDLILKLAPKTPNLELIARHLGHVRGAQGAATGRPGQEVRRRTGRRYRAGCPGNRPGRRHPGGNGSCPTARGRRWRRAHDALMSNPRVMLARALQERA